ncbi:MAG TPA: hypothetical protein DCL38_10005 [Lachnospiraceae bacterium]|nr:hypothetical protein [Lachnospiraceae bacterium]
MKDNGDGTVTVRFMKPNLDLDAEGFVYTGKPIYIKVPKQRNEEHGGLNALWVNIMENAYAGYLKQRELHKAAIDEFISKLSGQQKDEFIEKQREINEKLNAKQKESVIMCFLISIR